MLGLKEKETVRRDSKHELPGRKGGTAEKGKEVGTNPEG